MIAYGKQCLDEQDIQAVIEVLQSNYLTQGPKVPEFEKDLAQYCNANYAAAVNSATSALHLGCLALGVKEGDIVWTSTNSFVASSNSAKYCGAEIDFVDIDAKTYNICIKSLRDKLHHASFNNQLPKLIIPVHLCGTSCDMREIKDLSREFGFKILEDASHCIGGSYNDNRIGSCEFSDACVFSFHPVKIITTAEGGAITTNSKKLIDRIKSLRSHGIIRDSAKFKNKNTPPWYYEQHFLGFNYRMTEIQAALGSSQLTKVNQFINARWNIAKFYDEKIISKNVKKPDLNLNKGSSFHLYSIKLNNIDQRESLLRELKANKIFTTLHYFPIHLQPYYQQLGFELGNFPNAEEYALTALTLPIYPELTHDDQQKIVDIVNNVS